MEKMVLENGKELSLFIDNNTRGWDAADEYLLSQKIEGKNILIIGDSYGALTCGFSGNITTYTHSVLSRNYIASAMDKNGITANIITSINDFPSDIDCVVIKLPKSLDLYEYYLQIVGQRYSGASFLAGGMVKYMPITMVRKTEEYFNSVTTSLAKKKARLILGCVANNCSNPTKFPREYTTEHGLKVLSYPGVFSYDHLDIGTRFLIDYIPSDFKGKIMDLGSASGVLGLTAKIKNPDSSVVLTDESYLAIESAKENFSGNGLIGEFHVMDVLKGFESDSVDLILCNPPFHNDNKVTTDIALQMFIQSRRVLKRGGQLFIVANKHLGYHKKLREIYHNLKKEGENDKFFIYSVRKV